MNPRIPDMAKTILCTSITLAAILGAWWVATGYGGVPAYIIPSPSDVAAALKSGLVDGTLYTHIYFTMYCAVIGFLIGCTAGVAIGAVVAEFRSLEYSIYPLVTGLQSVPKVAVVPLIIAYLGFGAESKIFTAALLCFFPVFVNTVVGLNSADRGLIDLYRVYSASRWREFVDVRLPAAADHIFAALQIAVILAVIGCVVSEFMASTKGLGYIINSRAGELDVAMMFAAIVILAVIGSVTTLLVRRVHEAVVFWRAPSGHRPRAGRN